MSTNIIQPNRNQPVTKDGKMMTLRVAEFYDALVRLAEDLPDQGAAVADVSVSTTVNNTAAINALLASLRAANIIAT